MSLFQFAIFRFIFSQPPITYVFAASKTLDTALYPEVVMASSLKSETARVNGANSRGPKTPEGKLRSSANSLRHGLLARTVVLEDENGDTFADLLAAFERDLHPQNEVERSLVENMAIGRWRLLRLWAIERASLKSEMEKHDPEANDPATRAAMAFRALGDQSRCLDLLNRYEARFERQYARSLALLLKMDAAPSRENELCETNPRSC